MAYNNEQEITGQAAEISNHVVQSITKILDVGIQALSNPGEKVTLLAGGSIPSLGGLAYLFSKGSDASKTPSAAEVAFGACYIIACVDDHPNGIATNFAPETLEKALNIFKAVMGREYTEISPYLRQVIELQKKSANEGTPDYLKNFLPQ